MKAQFEVLMFIVCLNLATGLVIALQLPGTAYVNPATPTIDTTDYESHFNATATAKGWRPNPLTDFLGDVFSMFQLAFQNIKYLLDGFPQFLYWIRDSYITDPQGLTAFDLIANVFRAVYAVMAFWFVADYISGRDTG